MRTTATTLGLSCIAVLALAGPDASAATIDRSFVQNAAGACQSALPVFDGQIRKRPLALQNEGTAPAFVTCSFMGTDRSDAGITDILLYADNNSDAELDITCTLVTGASGVGAAYYPKTITIAANTQTSLFYWSAADNEGQNFDNYTTNVSCNLPVDTGLTATFIYFDEEIGALEP